MVKIASYATSIHPWNINWFVHLIVIKIQKWAFWSIKSALFC